jgi:hypothetical protein
LLTFRPSVVLRRGDRLAESDLAVLSNHHPLLQPSGIRRDKPLQSSVISRIAAAPRQSRLAWLQLPPAFCVPDPGR